MERGPQQAVPPKSKTPLFLRQPGSPGAGFAQNGRNMTHTMNLTHTVTLTENEAQVILAGLRLAVSYASELKQHSKAQLFDAALETLQAQLAAE